MVTLTIYSYLFSDTSILQGLFTAITTLLCMILLFKRRDFWIFLYNISNKKLLSMQLHSIITMKIQSSLIREIILTIFTEILKIPLTNKEKQTLYSYKSFDDFVNRPLTIIHKNISQSVLISPINGDLLCVTTFQQIGIRDILGDNIQLLNQPYYLALMNIQPWQQRSIIAPCNLQINNTYSLGQQKYLFIQNESTSSSETFVQDNFNFLKNNSRQIIQGTWGNRQIYIVLYSTCIFPTTKLSYENTQLKTGDLLGYASFMAIIFNLSQKQQITLVKTGESHYLQPIIKVE